MYEVLETTELTLVVGAVDCVQIAIRERLEEDIGYKTILNPLNMQVMFSA